MGWGGDGGGGYEVSGRTHKIHRVYTLLCIQYFLSTELGVVLIYSCFPRSVEPHFQEFYMPVEELNEINERQRLVGIYSLSPDVWKFVISDYLSVEDLVRFLSCCYSLRHFFEGYILRRRTLLREGMISSFQRLGIQVGRNISLQHGHPRDHPIRGMCFDKSGKLIIASVHRFGILSIWDPKTWISHGMFKISTIIYSICSIGDKLAVGTEGTIQIRRIDSMELILEIDCSDGKSVHSLCVDSHEMLVSGQMGGQVRVWNTITGQLVRELKGHSILVGSLKLLENGMLISRSLDGTFIVWDTLKGKSIMIINEGRTENVGTCVCTLSGGGFACGFKRGKIKVWRPTPASISVSAANSVLSCKKILEAHNGDVLSLHQLHDGNIVSGGFDFLMKVWDVEAATCVRVINVHVCPVNFIIAHPEFSSILSCSRMSDVVHVTAVDDFSLLEDDDDIKIHQRTLGVDRGIRKFRKCADYLFSKNAHRKAIDMCRQGLDMYPFDPHLKMTYNLAMRELYTFL